MERTSKVSEICFSIICVASSLHVLPRFLPRSRSFTSILCNAKRASHVGWASSFCCFRSNSLLGSASWNLLREREDRRDDPLFLIARDESEGRREGSERIFYFIFFIFPLVCDRTLGGRSRIVDRSLERLSRILMHFRFNYA